MMLNLFSCTYSSYVYILWKNICSHSLPIFFPFSFINFICVLAALGLPYSAWALCCCMLAFSSCGEQEPVSRCSAWASPYSDFSCCGAQSLGCGSSVVVAHGLSCPMACGILVPRLGIEPMSPALAGKFLTTGPPGKSSRF